MSAKLVISGFAGVFYFAIFKGSSRVVHHLCISFGSMIFGKDKMISYLYRFLLLVVPLI